MFHMEHAAFPGGRSTSVPIGVSLSSDGSIYLTTRRPFISSTCQVNTRFAVTNHAVFAFQVWPR